MTKLCVTTLCVCDKVVRVCVCDKVVCERVVLCARVCVCNEVVCERVVCAKLCVKELGVTNFI